MRLLTAAIAVCLITPLFGVPEIVQIPGGRITLDVPPIKDRLIEKDGGNFSYQASSGRLSLSIFMDPPAKPGGNQECYEFYWQQASGNPLISKRTIQASHTDAYHRISYVVATTIQGEAVTQQNVRYYFVFAGKWVGIHLTIMNPTPEDAALVAAFDKGLVYQANAPEQPE